MPLTKLSDHNYHHTYVKSIFIFQLREYPFNIAHDVYNLYIFLYATDIFRTKPDIPWIFLDISTFSAGKRHVL